MSTFLQYQLGQALGEPRRPEVALLRIHRLRDEVEALAETIDSLHRVIEPVLEREGFVHCADEPSLLVVADELWLRGGGEDPALYQGLVPTILLIAGVALLLWVLRRFVARTREEMLQAAVVLLLVAFGVVFLLPDFVRDQRPTPDLIEAIVPGCPIQPPSRST